ncbi:hypothetical protein ACFQV6_04405 [Actinoplanes sp. GCM10030250]
MLTLAVHLTVLAPLLIGIDRLADGRCDQRGRVVHRRLKSIAGAGEGAYADRHD